MRRPINEQQTKRFQRAMQAAIVMSTAALMVGCAGGHDSSVEIGGMRGVNNDAAENLNASHSRFGDANQDPPMSADTHYAAGCLAESQNANGQAVEQYKEALKVDPNSEKSLYRMGVVQTKLKLYPQAIETFKRYVAVTKNSPTALSNLAFCYELAGKVDEAEQTYQRGIESDPKSVACRVNYGLMLVRKNRISAATSQLSAVLAPAEVHYNIASVFEQQGRKADARTEYNKAIEADPTMRDARIRLADLK